MAGIIEDFKKEARRRKFEEFKEKVRSGAETALAWGMDHKKELFGAGAFLVGGGKMLARHHEKKAEERWRNRSFYDRSTGQYYMTKKDVSQSQHLQIEARRRNGEPLGQILASMKLL